MISQLDSSAGLKFVSSNCRASPTLRTDERRPDHRIGKKRDELAPPRRRPYR
jgi:hypothetical protein